MRNSLKKIRSLYRIWKGMEKDGSVYISVFPRDSARPLGCVSGFAIPDSDGYLDIDVPVVHILAWTTNILSVQMEQFDVSR